MSRRFAMTSRSMETPASSGCGSAACVGITANAELEMVASRKRIRTDAIRIPLLKLIGNRQHGRISRYVITYRWSRGIDLVVINQSPLGPAGPRLPGSRVVERSSRLTWSLLGSIGVHACMAIAVVMIAQRIT